MTEPRRLKERPDLTDVDLRIGRRCATDDDSPHGPVFASTFNGQPATGLGCIRRAGHTAMEGDINHVGMRFDPQTFYTEYWTW